MNDDLQSCRRGQGVIPVDMSIVLDATGSMGSFIAAVVKALHFTLDYFVAGALDVHFGLVIFRDELIGEMPELHPIGTPPKELKHVLSRTPATGGGDEPESSLPALVKALGLPGYRTGARKVLLLCTDASAHDPHGNLTSQMVLQELKRHRALLFACTPDMEPYKTLVAVTRGALFHIRPNLDQSTFENVLDNVARATVRTVRMLDSDDATRRAVDEFRKTKLFS